MRYTPLVRKAKITRLILIPIFCRFTDTPINSKMNQVPLDQTICAYYKKCASNPDSRYRSWDHCYGFFQKHCRDLHLPQVEDAAALQLGFYLASWGMYRGSGFLLQYAYTVHKPVIRALASSQFSKLWKRDIGTHHNDINLAATIMELVKSVRAAYRQFDEKPTDTLVTKVLLGTVGCLPARDRLFEKGFKDQGLCYGSLNCHFVDRILRFVIGNRLELAELQPKILVLGGFPYPLMKLVDMHFWQIGDNLESR